MTVTFFSQVTVSGLQAGVVYLLRVRASTVGLTGLPLWGPYSVLRVQDGGFFGGCHCMCVGFRIVGTGKSVGTVLCGY